MLLTEAVSHKQVSSVLSNIEEALWIHLELCKQYNAAQDHAVAKKGSLFLPCSPLISTFSFARISFPVYHLYDPHKPYSLKEWQLLLAKKMMLLKSLVKFTNYICSPHMKSVLESYVYSFNCRI